MPPLLLLHLSNPVIASTLLTSPPHPLHSSHLLLAHNLPSLPSVHQHSSPLLDLLSFTLIPYTQSVLCHRDLIQHCLCDCYTPSIIIVHRVVHYLFFLFTSQCTLSSCILAKILSNFNSVTYNKTRKSAAQTDLYTTQHMIASFPGIMILNQLINLLLRMVPVLDFTFFFLVSVAESRYYVVEVIYVK